MAIEVISGWLDKIPLVIGKFREVIMKVISALNLPEQSTFVLIAMAIAAVGAFFFLKQWVTRSIFFKLSTILNWLLIALLIYLVLVYVV